MIIERVKAVVARQFDVSEDDISGDTSFEDLGADQLDMTEFIEALSDEFECDIPEDAADRIETVDDAVKYVKKITD